MQTTPSRILLLLAAVVSGTSAASHSSSTTTHPPACTATSSTGSGAFFDLRPDTASRPEAGKSHKSGVLKDYHAKGHDYGKNFTLNICGPVVDPVTDVVGVKQGAWANVSAYYTSHDNVYSIGSVSLDLHSRGRKLVLQYTGGSPCAENNSKSSGDKREASSPSANDRDNASLYSTVQAHEIETIERDVAPKTRYKSTTISFLCDRDPGNSQASISFVGTDPDECAYFFEARSVHACAQAEPHKPGSVGPGSVFGLILGIAVLVYVLGGVFYNRTVAHARGWRQLPNYSLWAGIWSFFRDVFIMTLASCGRCLPSRRGYRHLGSSPSGRNRNRNSDAENRLIDQLDEEWDD